MILKSYTKIFIGIFFICLNSVSAVAQPSDTTELERVFILLKLTNVQQLDSNIWVDLKYSTSDNFLKSNVYGGLTRAYLHPEVASKLVDAQKILSDQKPGWHIVLLDATRPLSIQKIMWDQINVPNTERSKYLSEPRYGSLHNYGAAVDVQLLNENNQLVDMGTPFDSFEKLSYPIYELEYRRNGQLSEAAYQNRIFLRKLMNQAGFTSITTEWWHFNSCTRKEAKKRYTLVHSHFLKDYEVPSPEPNFLSNSDSEGLVFRVQIYTSGKPKELTWHKLNHQADFRYFHEGLYKYTSGAFKTLEEAQNHKLKMWSLGFKGSFIVPMYQNKRISIKDASEILQ